MFSTVSVKTDIALYIHIWKSNDEFGVGSLVCDFFL